MKPKRFAKELAAEKDALVADYFRARSQSSVAQQIAALRLPPARRKHLRAILDGALTDLCYTMLLALDGEARLGKLPQQEFRLEDGDGNVLTGGELEAAAWEVFHGDEE